MSGWVDGVPDVGMSRKVDRVTGIPRWVVDLSIYAISAETARILAAEMLDMADSIDELNAKIIGDGAA